MTYWHQLLLRGLSIGRQEEPLEVGRRSGPLLVRSIWQIRHEGIAAVPWTVALFAEPSPMSDQANTAIAIEIW
jgi:hypothetical protein